MIVRIWRGVATDADAYCRHFTGSVAPALKTLAGHRGAWLLRREIGDGSEILTLTLWDSREAIEAFAGSGIDKAVVAPEARAVLSDFDDFVRHYDVAFKAL
jgi:heme-degrading monooxygenase HmoA